MKKFLYLLALAAPLFAVAQNGSVDGKTTGVPYATIALLRLPDSAIVRTAISDTAGNFKLENMVYGNYMLKASFVGFRPYRSGAFQLSADSSSRSFVIGLQPLSQALKEVVVTDTKKLIESIPGGFVYNAAQNITAKNGDASDLLQQVPGIMIDPKSNILLRGGSPVVLVDGKEVRLTGADLAAYLKSIPSANIIGIEVITSPSAKYPAAGDAGILNIRLRKNTAAGWNGNLALTGTSAYGASQNGGFNYNAGKWNLSADYSAFVSGGSGNGSASYDSPGYESQQRSTSTSQYNGEFAGIGLGYDSDPKTSLGFDLKYGRFRGDYPADIFATYNTGQREYQHTLTSQLNRYLIADLNFRHQFKKQGAELTAYMNVADYANKSTVGFSQQYASPDSLASALNLSDLHYRFYTVQADYTSPISKVLKLAAGLKEDYSGVNSSYDSRFDPAMSDHLDYRQNLAAAYLSVSGKSKALSYQAGLRLENTAIGLNSQNIRSSASNYTDLFPNLSFKYQLDASRELNLSLLRRIQRPYYGYLNPFIDNSNSNYYSAGNPLLRPFYTNRAEVTFLNYWDGNKQLLMASAYYSYSTNVFGQLLISDPALGKPLNTYENFQDAHTFGASLTGQNQLASWWSLSTSLSGRITRYTSGLAGVQLPNARFLYTGNLSSNFTLPGHFLFQLTGNYQSAYNYYQQTIFGSGQLSAALQKDFFKNKLNLNLGVSDLLHTIRSKTQLISPLLEDLQYSQSHTRYVSLRAAFKFGKAAKPRKTVKIEGNGQI